MEKFTPSTPQDLIDAIGRDLGPSDYIPITQQQINQFAEATGDFQWIHVDEARAAEESPFKSTIAHGYLTVSLIPQLLFSVLDVQNCAMKVNYAIEKLRFQAPVLSGDWVRLQAKITEVKQLRDINRVNINVKLEIKNNKKPAFDGTVIILYYFK